MGTHGSYTRREPRVIQRDVGSLYCTPETNVTSCINYTEINKENKSFRDCDKKSALYDYIHIYLRRFLIFKISEITSQFQYCEISGNTSCLIFNPCQIVSKAIYLTSV